MVRFGIVSLSFNVSCVSNTFFVLRKASADRHTLFAKFANLKPITFNTAKTSTPSDSAACGA